jgi:hypothetical protein
MSPTTPWWYSGDESGPDVGRGQDQDRSADEATSAEDQPTANGTDWSALVLGAQRMVDWATERVMAPHADHGDPREHPTCVVCRTMALLGEVPVDPTDGGDDGGDGVTNRAEMTIHWIPVRDDRAEP